MFVALLAATLFMLSAATGGSAADSCATSLSSLVEGGGECPASESEDEVIQDVSTLLPGVVHCMVQARTLENPANSCRACRARARHPLRKLLDPQLHTVTSPSIL